MQYDGYRSRKVGGEEIKKGGAGKLIHADNGFSNMCLMSIRIIGTLNGCRHVAMISNAQLIQSRYSARVIGYRHWKKCGVVICNYALRRRSD